MRSPTNILATAINRNMSETPDFSLLANAVGIWIDELETNGFHFGDHNWTSKLIVVRKGVHVVCVESTEDNSIAFWLPIAPDKVNLRHGDTVARTIQEYAHHMRSVAKSPA